MSTTFWNPDWLEENILSKINSWEYFRWNNLDTGTEINHLAFEDIRRRLWLWEHPTAGKKTIQEMYSSWGQIKWCYAEGEGLDAQYQDENLNWVTLTEGYRWNVTNGAAQLGHQIADTTASMIYPGQLTFWDGDFYVGDKYIPPLLFTVDNGFSGYTNSNSLTPPINRTTGVIGNSYVSLTPDPNYYHDYDPNAGTKICGHWSKMPSPPPNDQSYYYNTSISASRYLPQCTDPKEQDNPILCWDSAGGHWLWQITDKVELSQAYINNLPHVSHYVYDDNTDCRGKYDPHPGYDLICRWNGVQGPANFMFSQNFALSNTCGNFRGHIPWPWCNPYTLAQGHPSTGYNTRARRYEIAKDESWSEPKYDPSYWAQIERVLEQNAGHFYPVNSDFQTNWLRYNNTYDTYEGKYTYGGSSPTAGEYNANKYPEQEDYALATSDYWNCNGSHTELVLKILGDDHYVWVLDYNSKTTYQPHDMIRMWYVNYFCGATTEELERELPWGIFCWRRIPRWQMGRYDQDSEGRQVLYWSPELGTPPGHIEDDCRRPITQAQYDAIPDRLGYKERWYRVVDLNAMFAEYWEKVGYYDPSTDFSQWGLDQYDVPSTPEGLQWIDEHWVGGERLPHPENPSELISHEAWVAYYTHPKEVARRDMGTYYQRSLKYEISAEHIQHMRHMLMVPQYRQIEPSWAISTCSTGGSNMGKGFGGMKPLGPNIDTICGGLRYPSYGEAFDAAVAICESIYKTPPQTTSQFNNQTVTLDVIGSYNSTYAYWDFGQPRSWSSAWSAPGRGATSDVGGWFGITKNVDITSWDRGREQCGETEGGFAAWDCHRGDACVVINDNSLIPDGARLYLRMYTLCYDNGYWAPMPIEAFGTSITPSAGLECHWLSVGVGSGTDGRWYYIKHGAGWQEHIGTWLQVYSNNTWFYHWDYEPPSWVWDRRTVHYHEVEDCSVYPAWMTGIDPDGEHDSDGDGVPDHNSPRDWRDDQDNDTPEWQEPPTLEDEGSF